MKQRIIRITDRVVEYCLYGLVFSIAVSKAGIEIFASLMILSFLIKKILAPDFRFLKNYTHLFLGLFVGFCALSLFNSGPYLKLSLRALISKWLEYVAIFIMAEDIFRNPKPRRNCLFILLGVSFIICLDGLSQRFLGIEFLKQRMMIDIGGGSVYAITANFKHFNDLGSYLACLLTLVIGLLCWSHLRKQNRLALGFLGALLGICLVLTLSRGAWLGFMFALILMLILTRKFKVLIVILCIFIIALALLPTARERLIEHGDAGRAGIWQGAVAMIRDNPFLGKGLGTFMIYFPRYAKHKHLGIQYAHNCYLQIWAEIGIFGLLSFLLFVGSILHKGIKVFLNSVRDSSLREQSLGLLLGLLCAIFAFFLHSFFDTQLYSLQQSVLFWILLGMIVGFG